jgi:hypothetical protein
MFLLLSFPRKRESIPQQTQAVRWVAAFGGMTAEFAVTATPEHHASTSSFTASTHIACTAGPFGTF